MVHAENVEIGLTTYAKDGGVLGTDSSYTAADKLKPGQKSTFDIMSSKDSFKKMNYYELSLQWRDPDGTDQYIENVQLYQEDGKNQAADGFSNKKGNNDDNDNEKSHLARDIRKAID